MANFSGLFSHQGGLLRFMKGYVMKFEISRSTVFRCLGALTLLWSGFGLMLGLYLLHTVDPKRSIALGVLVIACVITVFVQQMRVCMKETDWINEYNAHQDTKEKLAAELESARTKLAYAESWQKVYQERDAEIRIVMDNVETCPLSHIRWTSLSEVAVKVNFTILEEDRSPRQEKFRLDDPYTLSFHESE